MKRLFVAGLCMLAVLAFSAIAVAGASAKPSFVPESGKFPVSFTGKSTEPLVLKPTLTSETSNPIVCKEDTSTGEITGSMQVKKVVVTFTGCETEVLGGKVSCGTIKTTSLEGTLGYVNKTTMVGVMLSPEVPTLFAEFKCSILTVKVTGTGVIGEVPLTDLNKQTKTSHLVYTNVNNSTQSLTELELLGGTIDKPELTSSVGGKAAQMSEDTLTSTENVEIEG